MAAKMRARAGNIAAGRLSPLSLSIYLSPFLFLHELARSLHVPRDAVSSWVL